MSSLGVVLDACVLIPATLRDTLLRTAEKGMYRLHWKDFPRQALDPFGIEAQTPGEFLTHVFHSNPTLMMEILSEQAQDLNDPPLTVPDVLEILAIIAPEFVKLIQ